MSGREDMEQLLSAVLPFAEQMLGEHGEFFPFGATMSSDGEVALTAADSAGDRPGPEEGLGVLNDGFRRQREAGEIRASALCCDVTFTPQGEQATADAVRVQMEHREVAPVIALVPYEGAGTPEMAFGELIATPGERIAFD